MGEPNQLVPQCQPTSPSERLNLLELASSPRDGDSCQGLAALFLNILGAPLVGLSEIDMFHPEAEIYENINSLKPDTVGNLGEHISTSRRIMIMQIIEELHFVF